MWSVSMSAPSASTISRSAACGAGALSYETTLQRTTPARERIEALTLVTGGVMRLTPAANGLALPSHVLIVPETQVSMGPLAICLLLGLVPGFIAQTRETLEGMGASPFNSSWWPV